MRSLKYYLKENIILTINTDKNLLELAIAFIILLNISCSAQRGINDTVEIKGYKSFTLNGKEYEIIDEGLIDILDDFIKKIESCKSALLTNNRPPIYILIEEFNRGKSARIGLTARNSYSVSFDLDEHINSVVDMHFKPTSIAKYKGYYISLSSYLNDENKEYLLSRIEDTGKTLVYSGRALVDELGNWVLDDTEKIEIVYEINDNLSLSWLYESSCKD